MVSKSPLEDPCYQDNVRDCCRLHVPVLYSTTPDKRYRFNSVEYLTGTIGQKWHFSGCAHVFFLLRILDDPDKISVVGTSRFDPLYLRIFLENSDFYPRRGRYFVPAPRLRINCRHIYINWTGQADISTLRRSGAPPGSGEQEINLRDPAGRGLLTKRRGVPFRAGSGKPAFPLEN
ncbi:MAG: hypothetical protein METHP_00363 [Methanoregula sp. SKADARSKE-2]|nr:MAG: hypothetical protein METHP_00363 [Methanoregula sp. SKADARSKE-2]